MHRAAKRERARILPARVPPSCAYSRLLNDGSSRFRPFLQSLAFCGRFGCWTDYSHGGPQAKDARQGRHCCLTGKGALWCRNLTQHPSRARYSCLRSSSRFSARPDSERRATNRRPAMWKTTLATVAATLFLFDADAQMALRGMWPFASENVIVPQTGAFAGDAGATVVIARVDADVAIVGPVATTTMTSISRTRATSGSNPSCWCPCPKGRWSGDSRFRGQRARSKRRCCRVTRRAGCTIR